MATSTTLLTSLAPLRTALEGEENKVFYKDVEMICGKCTVEWLNDLEHNVSACGLPFVDLFAFSAKDSVYIIKQTGEAEEKTYDISDKFNSSKTRKICRQYKAYTFFKSKNFAKYISTVVDAKATYKIVPTGTDTFAVQLWL